MMIKHLVRILVILVMGFATSQFAAAQVPPHMPGTICLTPQFWCWAEKPGTPGTRCTCKLVISDPGTSSDNEEKVRYVEGVLG